MKTTVLYVSYCGKFVSRQFRVGVQRYAKLKGWNLQIVPWEECRRLRQLIDFWKPIGCILEDSADVGDRLLADGRKLPVVALDGQDSAKRKNRFRIMHDSRASAELAARALMSLGRDHYAFVGFPYGANWSKVREDAFREILRQGGKPCCVYRPSGTKGEWNRSLCRWLGGLPRPCAVFAANDEVGIAVMSACAHLGLSVPDDVAVLGVDNDEELCESATPTLSSIHVDAERGGYMAAELLDERLRNPSMKPQVRFFGPLMVMNRMSTCSRARSDDRVRRGVEFIRNGIGGELSVGDIARSMGCSERQARFLFAEALGHSVQDEIRNARLERVFFYLRCTKCSISAIANFVGLRDPASLRRFFREQTGRSLSDWRKSH